MSTYGAVGTNPLRDLSSTVEHLLAGLIQSNYDQTITGIPFSNIAYESWWSGYGDCAIYFQHAGDFDISAELSFTAQDIKHHTDIHIFVRSLNQDYNNSGEKILFGFESMIKKILRINKEGLKSEGIYKIEYEDTRSLPLKSNDDDVKRIIISVCSYIRLINNNP